jgi:ATP-dependent RNA circularization protein (DNA/RNA ligase family)
MEYPKIHNLLKRDEDTGKLIRGAYSKEEFLRIDRWLVTEKIDGTNIRVYWTKNSDKLVFKGRKEKSVIPPFLLETLNNMFDIKKFNKVFDGVTFVVLYGEGYGNKIQKVGPKYRKDTSFILFDCIIDAHWLNYEDVKDIAQKLGIDCVPLCYRQRPSRAVRGEVRLDYELNITNIYNLVRNPFDSFLDTAEPLKAEGVVARSYPVMRFRDINQPIMWKLKTKDLQEMEKE